LEEIWETPYEPMKKEHDEMAFGEFAQIFLLITTVVNYAAQRNLWPQHALN
jgi:hypothetical protein